MGGGTRQRTEELFGQSITRFRPNLSQKQQYVLEQAKNNILDDIDTFNIWAQAQTPETLASLSGEIFPMVDPQHLRLDTQRFPGAVLIEVTNPETFRQIRVGEKTQGFYNPDLGEGLLKGRILVVNVSEEINEDVARHEYQHFLFAHAADELEFVPEVSKRKAIAQTQKDAHMFHSKRKKLQNTLMEARLDAEDEHAEIGVVTPETAQKLSIITSQLKELPQQESIKHTAREVAFGTYPDGPIRRAFHTFRNEMMAYSTGEATQLRFDAYFGKTLETAAQDPYYEQFKVEVELVKGLLQFALRKGVSLKQLGYVVGCSRNMQQAAKYIYLETRRVANDLDA